MRLGYGLSTLDLHTDAAPLLPSATEAIRPWAPTCQQALTHPIGSPPLADWVDSTSQVVIIVNDNTRHANTRAFLPHILEQLKAAGVRSQRISILFALGAHRPLTFTEQALLVGETIARDFALFNHDAHAVEQLVRLGTTTRGTPVWINRLAATADLRILTGSIVPHFFAGFGGGRKALVPGVAGYETICANHRLMLDAQATTCQLQGNPVHEDLLEAASMCSPSFLFNVVLKGDDLLGAWAGDVGQAHLVGCEMALARCRVTIPRLSQTVVASAGGWPYDLNFYQAQKALDNAARAVVDGGDLVLVAACAEGWGSAAFLEWMLRYPDAESMGDALYQQFELGGHKAYAVRRVLDRIQVHLLSTLPPSQVRALGMIPITQLETGPASGSNGTICVLPQAAHTVPQWSDSKSN